MYQKVKLKNMKQLIKLTMLFIPCLILFLWDSRKKDSFIECDESKNGGYAY